MFKLRLIKLMTAILCILLGFVLILYFSVVGVVGVFVISQNVIGKICENFGEVSSTLLFALNIIIATFLGMLPFGLFAAKFIPVCFKKWNIPTIQDALKDG